MCQARPVAATPAMAETELYYRHHVFCCANQRPPGHARGCCQEKNAESLRNYLKRRAKEAGLNDIRVNHAGCLDRCEHGPVIVVYTEGVWYRPQTEADMDEILTEHLQHGRLVERLLLPGRNVAEK